MSLARALLSGHYRPAIARRGREYSRRMSTRPRVNPLVKAEMGGGGSKVWSEITELARLPSIVSDLGQGYPDFEGSLVARSQSESVLHNAARLNQYSLVNGTADLRESLSNFYNTRHPDQPRLNPNTEVLVTTSGTESLYAGILATVQHGDEVIVFEPSFPWYAPDIRIAGGTLKTVTLKYPNFSIDEKELRSAFSPKTKLVIVNSPHNPTGHVARKHELELIAELCVKYNALCISDEVYDQFVFDTSKTGSHLRMCDMEGMRDRTLTVGSASKLFSLTGWRVGWLYGPTDLIAASRAVHSFATYCAPTPLQDGVRIALDAAAKELNAIPSEMPGINELFLDNAKRLASALEKSFGVTSAIPEGGYFLVSDISITGKTDVEFCSMLAKERGVVAVPMTVFFSGSPVNNLVRFSICKKKETIDKAVAAILGDSPANGKKQKQG